MTGNDDDKKSGDSGEGGDFHVHGDLHVYGGQVGSGQQVQETVGAGTTAVEQAGESDAALRKLKRAVRQRAERLAQVFRVTGGPRTAAEVTVELSFRGQPREVRSGDLWKQQQRFAGDLVEHQALALERGAFPLGRLLETKHSRWVVLGEPGSGKTTALRHLALTESSTRFVLLAKVADLVRAHRDGTGIVAGLGEQLARGCGVALVGVVQAQQAAVLLDGLDEVVDK